jgi:hypothetical protein
MILVRGVQGTVTNVSRWGEQGCSENGQTQSASTHYHIQQACLARD